MPYTVPTVADFKSRFDRDFPFCTDQTDLTKFRDKDVTLALTQTSAKFNPGLWESQAIFTEAYLLKAAHYLVTNYLASSQGTRGQGQWLTASKAIGNLSQAYNIPLRILRSPTMALYSGTTYGCQYLALAASRMTGNFVAVIGRTTSA